MRFKVLGFKAFHIRVQGQGFSKKVKKGYN